MRFLGVALLLVAGAAWAQDAPTVATDVVIGGVSHNGVVWVHPTDVTQSLVITADDSGGLSTYGLDGHGVALASPDVTAAVDVRYNVPVNGATLDLVAAADLVANGLAFYSVDPTLRALNTLGSFSTGGVTPAGVALYVDATGALFGFVTDANGAVAQYAITFDTSSHPQGTLVRSMSVPSAAAGTVADDLHHALYVTETNNGLWRFAADADAGTTGTLLDSTAGGHLGTPIDGVALYAESSGDGYLLLSNASASTYAVYGRLSGSYVTQFGLDAGTGIDAPQQSAGIAVMSYGLGGSFPQGLFVVQDSAGNDFKYVPWNGIATAYGLVIDPTDNPRAVASDGGTSDGGTTGGGGGGGGGGGRGQGDINPAGSGCTCGHSAALGGVGMLLLLAAMRRRAKSPS